MAHEKPLFIPLRTAWFTQFARGEKDTEYRAWPRVFALFAGHWTLPLSARSSIDDTAEAEYGRPLGVT